MPINRNTLIGLCEQASVPQARWRRSDSEKAQRQVGECLMLLRAGCEFHVGADGDTSPGVLIWVNIRSKGFDSVEYGGLYESHLYYLPTQKRLDAVAGKDWY